VVALVAASGSATAASLITSDDIKNGTIKSKDVKNGTIKNDDIKESTITRGDLEKRVRRLLDEQGAAGPAGPAGQPGPTGAPGVSGYEVATFTYPNVGAGNIATVACSSGKVAVAGGYWFHTAGDNNFDFAHPAIANGSGVIASFPGRMDFDGVDNIPNTPDDNTVKPNDNSGWIVQLNSRPGQDPDEVPPDPAEEFDQRMTLYAICVNA
jgi:hypothetical protein